MLLEKQNRWTDYAQYEDCIVRNDLKGFKKLLDGLSKGMAFDEPASFLTGKILEYMENSNSDRTAFFDVILPKCTDNFINSIEPCYKKNRGITQLQRIIRSKELSNEQKKSLIRTFCRHGADPNVLSGPPSNIPALLMTDEPEIIDVLAECGAMFNLICPSDRSDPSTLLYFFLYNIYLSSPDSEEKLESTFERRFECLKRFVKYKAPLNPVVYKKSWGTKYLTGDLLLDVLCKADFLGQTSFGKGVSDGSLSVGPTYLKKFCAMIEEYALKACQFLTESGMNVNIVNIYGENALFYCDTIPLFRYLLTHIKDPMRTNSDGMSFIHRIAGRNNVGLLNEVAGEGFDMNAVDNVGRTPLFYASDADILRLLIKNGADINHTDYYGDPMFIYSSCILNYKNVLEACVKAGADFSIRTYKGKTVLHAWAEIAAARTSVKTDPIITNSLCILVNGGAEINAQDENGDTPMHDYFKELSETEYKNAMPVVTAMLDAGADPRIMNNDNKSVLDVIKSGKICKKIEQYLEYNRIVGKAIEDDIKTFER